MGSTLKGKNLLLLEEQILSFESRPYLGELCKKGSNNDFVKKKLFPFVKVPEKHQSYMCSMIHPDH